MEYKQKLEYLDALCNEMFPIEAASWRSGITHDGPPFTKENMNALRQETNRLIDRMDNLLDSLAESGCLETRTSYFRANDMLVFRRKALKPEHLDQMKQECDWFSRRINQQDNASLLGLAVISYHWIKHTHSDIIAHYRIDTNPRRKRCRRASTNRTRIGRRRLQKNQFRRLRI
jgi:hypothetical protein